MRKSGGAIAILTALLSLTPSAFSAEKVCRDFFVAADAKSVSSTALGARAEKRVRETLEIVRQRGLLPPPAPREIRIDAVRRDLFETLYRSGLVEAGPLTQHLSDKLVNAEVLRRLLGKENAHLHPFAAGLNTFLIEHGIVDRGGTLLKDRQAIADEFARAFPRGFVIKAAEGEASHGEGLIVGAAEAAALVSRPSSPLWSAHDLATPAIGSISGKIGSGERFMIMELIPFSGLADPQSAIAKTNEFRVHVFDGQVVPNATLQRNWRPTTEEVFAQVNARVQQIFDLLPAGYKSRQAYSLDIFLLPDGTVRIIEVNTNSGRERTWSGFMRYPQVIAAHVKMIEERYGWRFTGQGGDLLRIGAANVKNALGTRTLALAGDFKAGKIRSDQVISKFKELSAQFGDPLKAYAKGGHVLEGEGAKALQFVIDYDHRLEQIHEPGDAAWEKFDQWLSGEFSE